MDRHLALQPDQILRRTQRFPAPRRACLGGGMILHYYQTSIKQAPTELVSVDAMIGHYPVPQVKNHSLHRDKLGGGDFSHSFVRSAESSHHRREVGGVVVPTLVAAKGRAKVLGVLCGKTYFGFVCAPFRASSVRGATDETRNKHGFWKEQTGRLGTGRCGQRARYHLPVSNFPV